jgi:thiol-disulfide isomerase/thioredoxin
MALLLGGAADRRAAAGDAPVVANFVLKDLDGKDVSLADLRAGGPVVLDFWATWCKPCLRELPHLEAIRKQYAESGLSVVAISIDDTRSVAKVKSYVKTHDYGFKVLLDSNQRVLRQVQGTGVPYVVVVSADGRLLYSHSGYRDGDEKELAKVVAEAMGGTGSEGAVGDGSAERAAEASSAGVTDAPGAGGSDGSAAGGSEGSAGVPGEAPAGGVESPQAGGDR